MIFLNPDLDPFGKGYHIIQSKIAIGSVVEGNGFLGGSQSNLDFLPEKKQILFLLFSEQFGFTGSIYPRSIFISIFNSNF